jgi:hypothetical protein
MPGPAARRRVLVGLLLALVGAPAAVGCRPNLAYQCGSDPECASAGAEGVCEPNGFCSFPDPVCPSGRRFGEWAGNSLGDTCVGAGADVDADPAAPDARPSPDARVDADPALPDAGPGAIVEVWITDRPGGDVAGATFDNEIVFQSMSPAGPDVDHTSVDAIPTTALLRFSMQSVPAGATILEARVEFASNDPTYLLSTGEVGAFPVIERWIEDQVTFFERQTGVAWATAGPGEPGSRTTDPLFTFTAAAVESYSFPLPAALVQAWVGDFNLNGGLAFMASEGAEGHLHIVSAEGEDTLRPALFLKYQLP